MAEAKVRTFVCDAPGCRSNATLHPTDDQTPESALLLRGWGVIPTVDGIHCDMVPGKHYCPLHKEMADVK